jgi:hypothetical protein
MRRLVAGRELSTAQVPCSGQAAAAVRQSEHESLRFISLLACKVYKEMSCCSVQLNGNRWIAGWGCGCSS